MKKIKITRDEKHFSRQAPRHRLAEKSRQYALSGGLVKSDVHFMVYSNWTRNGEKVCRGKACIEVETPGIPVSERKDIQHTQKTLSAAYATEGNHGTAEGYVQTPSEQTSNAQIVLEGCFVLNSVNEECCSDLRIVSRNINTAAKSFTFDAKVLLLPGQPRNLGKNIAKVIAAPLVHTVT